MFCAKSPSFVQVRGVITCPLGLVTASRDKTVKIWTQAEDQYVLDKNLVSVFNPIAEFDLTIS